MQFDSLKNKQVQINPKLYEKSFYYLLIIKVQKLKMKIHIALITLLCTWLPFLHCFSANQNPVIFALMLLKLVKLSLILTFCNILNFWCTTSRVHCCNLSCLCQTIYPTVSILFLSWIDLFLIDQGAWEWDAFWASKTDGIPRERYASTAC